MFCVCIPTGLVNTIADPLGSQAPATLRPLVKGRSRPSAQSPTQTLVPVGEEATVTKTRVPSGDTLGHRCVPPVVSTGVGVPSRSTQASRFPDCPAT